MFLIVKIWGTSLINYHSIFSFLNFPTSILSACSFIIQKWIPFASKNVWVTQSCNPRGQNHPLPLQCPEPCLFALVERDNASSSITGWSKRLRGIIKWLFQPWLLILAPCLTLLGMPRTQRDTGWYKESGQQGPTRDTFIAVILVDWKGK